jgi:hypothetical protein
MAELSLEKAIRLHGQARIQIQDLEKIADSCARFLSELERVEETPLVIAQKGILKTQLALCFINLDLCAAYRQYLSTDTSTNYEKRQAITKINIVMSEGYKKIYGFKEQQKQKSFWISQIKTTVVLLGIGDTEFDRIEGILSDFEFDKIINQDMRNLSIHYDEDPLKVYNMLSSLSAEEVIDRCINFLVILAEVFRFVSKLTDELIPQNRLLYSAFHISYL